MTPGGYDDHQSGHRDDTSNDLQAANCACQRRTASWSDKATWHEPRMDRGDAVESDLVTDTNGLMSARFDTRTKVGAATSNPIGRPAYGWSRAVAKNPPIRSPLITVCIYSSRVAGESRNCNNHGESPVRPAHVGIF
jgi:hypothetical protein